MKNKGTLYLVSTPIGNLKDITYRAIETLNYVDIIVCENPINSKKLLSFYNINKKTIQLNSILESKNTNNIINLLLEGNNIAYISDAGTPCISDPGNILLNNAINNDIKTIAIPGPSAFLTALTNANVDTSNFSFYGFLSNKPGTCKNQLISLSKQNSTLIIYESSHRINKTISLIKEIFNPEVKIVIARELTKIHEDFIRSTVKEITLTEEQTKGEFVILIENKIENNFSDEEILNLLNDLIKKENLTKKEAIKKLSEQYNISKNQIYKLSIK